MPQFQVITLTTTTWTPERMKGDVAFYSDTTEAIVELRKTLSVSIAPPTKTSKLYKVRTKLTLPVADPITGQYSYSNTFDSTFLLPKASDASSRGDLLLDVQELVAAAGGIIEAQVVNLTPIY